MSFGQLNRSQVKAVKPLVAGRVVHDLGCGDRQLSAKLVSWGADRVVAVDHDPGGYDRIGIETVYQSFKEYLATNPEIDVAFLSWPTNVTDDGLVELVARADRVVYLGKNTDGVACGTPRLFRHLWVTPVENTCVFRCEVPVSNRGRFPADWRLWREILGAKSVR